MRMGLLTGFILPAYLVISIKSLHESNSTVFSNQNIIETTRSKSRTTMRLKAFPLMYDLDKKKLTPQNVYISEIINILMQQYLYLGGWIFLSHKEDKLTKKYTKLNQKLNLYRLIKVKFW